MSTLIEAKNRLITRRELEQLIGLRHSAIYARMDPNSPTFDPEFPRPIPLGGAPERPSAVRWLSSEVSAWIASRIAARDAA